MNKIAMQSNKAKGPQTSKTIKDIIDWKDKDINKIADVIPWRRLITLY